MAENQTKFQVFLQEELDRYKGVYVPLKAGFLHRMLVKKAPCKMLHPNPEDVFCDPKVGPNYEIISRYEKEIWQEKRRSQQEYIKEPLIVEKMHPDGYMILNGHHRWAAAIRMALPTLPIKIVNLTHAIDIQRMIENAKHHKRVSLDLDEAVFLSDSNEQAEKTLSFPFNKLYRERLRRGVPALFHFLKANGYDIWVFTAKYYSMDYIQQYFKLFHLRIDGIVTGTCRKERSTEEEKKRLEALIANKYAETIHIDSNSLLRIHSATKDFEEFSLTGNPATWSQEVMEIIGALEKNESTNQ